MQTVVSDSASPGFLLPFPEPRLAWRKFNKQPYQGWEGYMLVDGLHGWLGNPRLDIPIQRFKEIHSRPPTDDEQIDLVLEYSSPTDPDEPDVGDEDEKESLRRFRRNKLNLLAESVRINGVREPLIVTYDRKLLDGNRRFLACLSLLNQRREDDPQLENYTKVPVWVLPKAASREDEDRVITEMNFIDDGRQQWPYSVRAKQVYQDHRDGMDIDELAEKYHTWTKTRIRAVIEAARVAEQFIEHHDDAPEAREVAYHHLVWFDELQRNNRKTLEDPEFREAIFDMLLEEGTDGKSRFRRSRDFVRLGKIYDDPEAWAALRDSAPSEAVRKAEFVLDRKRFEDESGAESRIQRVNDLLRGLEATPEVFARVKRPSLEEFHRLAEGVPGAPVDARSRAARMVEWLGQLTSNEVAHMPPDLLTGLDEALARVTRQAHAYHAS